MPSPRPQAMRLPPQPGEVIQREKAVSFRWNGRPFSGFAGDTIVSALAASGERVFSRSFKYHRPRGILSASLHDPNCQVQLPDEPNVRAAHRQIEADMEVTPQNVWPSLGLDIRAGTQWIHRFLPVGFYYKTFIRPKTLAATFERILRFMGTPGGIAPDHPPTDRFDKRHIHADVAVIGGGPAGIAAALGAAESGQRVVLIEEELDIGGHLRWGDQDALILLDSLRSQIKATPNIEVITDCSATGLYDGNQIAAVQRSHPQIIERLIKLRARMVVVAAGLLERPYVFAHNDLPGVMLASAAQRLIRLYAVKPGRRAVVFSANAEGDAAVETLRGAGIEITRVIDGRTGQKITAAHGRKRLRAVETDRGERMECDLLVTSAGWTTPTSFLNMAGAKPEYLSRAARFVINDLPDGVLATGGIVGDGSALTLIEHGEAVGVEAARRARPKSTSSFGLTNSIPPLSPANHPETYLSGRNGFVDFSEDVSADDIIASVSEGFSSIQLAKRFSTATMGPAQGKFELLNTMAAHAEGVGTSISETGTTTWRPPWTPITLGALAGRPQEPTRISPLHEWHAANGAQWLHAGQWLRPEHYGDPEGEVRSVREAVGIIDVCPIGKIDLRGPDVPLLLNHLYVNKWLKLPIGSVRYGVMCREDGVVFDDGVTARLAEEHFIMSTTSSGAGQVYQWIEEWLQTTYPDWQIHATAVTDLYTSINVAGPSSRDLLLSLCEGIDLSNSAFGHMQVREGQVAGVPCLMWRIGFTGELSFEIHVPAAYGLHVWHSLLENGQVFGIRPFGVEAQRILRLEKGHFIVGQDTDGLTQGYSAGLSKTIRLDKPDFVGKPELVWQQQEHARYQLASLQPIDPECVPPEACQIVDEAGQILGRVTSSRRSPTLDRSICLAQLNEAHCAPNTIVTIRLAKNQLCRARVIEGLAHYDPDRSRLRV